jgi:ABC-type transporter Mla MlaB component
VVGRHRFFTYTGWQIWGLLAGKLGGFILLRFRYSGDFKNIGMLRATFLGTMNFAIATNPPEQNTMQPRPPIRRKRPLAEVPEEMLSVREEKGEDGIYLSAYGQLDLVTVIPFRDAVFEAIGEKPRYVALDLSEMRTIEAPGISALVTLARVAQMMKVEFTVQMPESLQEWVTESGLERLLQPAPATGVNMAHAIFSQNPLE